VDDLGSESNVIAFRPKSNLLLRPADMERHLQTAFDQHRNGGAVLICPRMRSFFPVLVDPPFQFHVRLVPQSKFGWNELTDEPSAAADLVGFGVAEVEQSIYVHITRCRNGTQSKQRPAADISAEASRLS
jgi:hypothetical protein